MTDNTITDETVTDTALPHDVADTKDDPAANYSVLSVITHWLGALAILILAVTELAGWTSVHTSLGLLLAVPLIWRVLYRLSRGFARAPDQHPTISFIERMIILALLAAMLFMVVTGLLMPLLSAQAYSFFDPLSWTAPYDGNPAAFGVVKNIHVMSAAAILPLFVAHIAVFARHAFFRKQSNTLRMLKPLKDGR